MISNHPCVLSPSDLARKHEKGLLNETFSLLKIFNMFFIEFKLYHFIFLFFSHTIF